jgi:hypothetical protein
VDEHEIPRGGLKDALDYNIDREGYIHARLDYELLSDVTGFSDLYEVGNVTYAVSAGAVGIVGESGFTALRAVTGAVGWSQLNGRAVFCDYSGVYLIEGATTQQLILRATLDDEERYGLTDMPGGHWLAFADGRLFVLRGRSLLWSEALDYGSHSPARNFIRFKTNPTWMAPVDGGIFVGLAETVVFLRGNNPAEYKLEEVSGLSCPGAALVVPSRYMAPELQGGHDVAVWFGETGFVVGRADGSVVYPQAEQIRELPIVPRKLVVIEERVYAFPIEE